MDLTTVLCNLPPGTTANCCSPAPSTVAVSANVSTVAGLSAIQYRIGTFSSFRRTMLADVPKPDLLLSNVTTTLTTPVDASSTTIQVSDFTQFPSSNPFRIKIGTEYLQVISGAGTPIWTVARSVDQSAPSAHLVNDAVAYDPANPFVNWREGNDSDYHTMFIELWAYVADVLTFYQERIANEAYLGTATQRDSMMRLAELIDNHPSPGAGASAMVTFSMAKGKTATVPANFRVGSKASAGKAAAVFETSGAVTAVSDHNAMPVATVLPQDQFGHISSTVRTVVLQGTNNRLSVGDYVLLVTNENNSGESATAFRVQSVGTDKASNTTTITWTDRQGSSYGGGAIPVHLYAFRVTASVFGSNAPEWDSLPPALTVGLASPPTQPIYSENWDDASKPSHYLPLKNNESDHGNPSHGYIFLDSVYDAIKASPQSPGWVALLANSPGPTFVGQSIGGSPLSIVYHLTAASSVSVTGFTLNTKVTRLGLGNNQTVQGSKFPIRTTSVFAAAQRLALQNNLPVHDPAGGSSIVVSGLYPLLQTGQQVMVSGKLITSESAQLGSAPAFDFLANTTTLTLRSPLTGQYDPTTTSIVIQGERLVPAGNAWVNDVTITVSGVHSNLQSGQTLVVRGTPATGSQSGMMGAEARVLSGPPILDTTAQTTTLNFTKALTNQYDRASTVVMANVVAITQGETVRDEILGSGDATPLQSFILKKKPLTYLPSTSSEGLAAVQSTLTVTVNGVAWSERSNLIESAASAQDYMLRTDDSGQSTVFFGDGFKGATPSSGRDNIHARYRKGLGTSGNVLAGGIQQLVDSATGLQKVTNPAAASGGADPDTIAEIRVNAPASVTTFGRAISAPDYASLALQFPGIQKATASWIRIDENLKPVPVPYVQLTVGTSDGTQIEGSITGKNLRSYLDNHRDPNIPLRILDFNPVYVDVNLTIDVEDKYPRQATLNRVLARLNPGVNPGGTYGYFSFQNLQFGQNIHLSVLYAVVQGVEGVRDLRFSTFRRMDTDSGNPAMVRNDIFVRPTELAVIGNDAGTPDHGLLQVELGVGGFVDA